MEKRFDELFVEALERAAFSPFHSLSVHRDFLCIQ